MRSACTDSRRMPALVALLIASAWSLPARADDPAVVIVYAGYGTPTSFHLWGRVLEDPGVSDPDSSASRWRNAVDAARRFESDEIEDAPVRARIGGRQYEARTDDDGVWRFDGKGVSPPLPVGPMSVTVEAPEHGASGEATLYILAEAPGVAVISDFDDTVVQTHVTSKVRMLKGVLTKNAAQLEPVPGVSAAFQRARRAGAVAFFFVSGSPQNLYDRIADFLRLNRLPLGPVFLKNVGEDSLTEQIEYKKSRITALLEAFPRLQVVLVGDSGEKDPEVYRAIDESHPGRVVGIVIRRVAGDESAEGRLDGMRVVDDYTGDPNIIGALVSHPAGSTD